MKNKIFLVLRVLILLILFYYLLSKTHLKTLFAIIKNANLYFLSVAFLFYFIYLLFLNLRWHIILNKTGIRMSFLSTLKISLISYTFNTVLPSTIGGDTARFILLKYSKSKVLSTIIIDRFSGFFGIFLMTFLISTYIALKENPYFLTLSITGIIFMIIGFFIIFYPPIFQFLTRRFEAIKFFNLGVKMNKLYNELHEYRNRIPLILTAVLITFFIHLSSSFVWYFSTRSLGVEDSLWRFIIFIPVINLIAMIPITPGGFGLREASFYKFFSSYKDMAVGGSLLYIFFTLIYASIGGFLFIFNKQRRKEDVESKRKS